MTIENEYRYRADQLSYIRQPEGDYFEVDWYKDLAEAINDMSGFDWEEMEDSRKDVIVIVDTFDNTIAAVGRCIESRESQMPVLLWMYRDGKTEKRFYKTEHARHIDQGEV